jgi:hypothetical protein
MKFLKEIFINFFLKKINDEKIVLPDQYPDRLLVKVPEGNGYKTPEQMKRVDNHLNSLSNAFFASYGGLPRQRDDGMWEVFFLEPSEIHLVKAILERHYGFEVLVEE